MLSAALCALTEQVRMFRGGEGEGGGKGGEAGGDRALCCLVCPDGAGSLFKWGAYSAVPEEGSPS